MKGIKKLFMVLGIAAIAFVSMNAIADVVNPSVVSAETDGLTEFKKSANITSKTETASTGIKGDLDQVIIILMTIGGVWSIFWLIIGAMMLQGSAGNPQKRGQGIACLVTALVGVFIIVKVYDIAGWVANLGTT